MGDPFSQNSLPPRSFVSIVSILNVDIWLKGRFVRWDVTNHNALLASNNSLVVV